MPATRAGVKPAKRKREAKAEGRSAKRARSESQSSGDDDDDPQGRILLLENEILESKKNYNNITTLIGIAKDGSDAGEEAPLVATVSLCRVFIRLLASGQLVRKQGLSEKEVVVVHWLKDRLLEFERVLLDMFLREEQATTALTLSMRLLKAEGQYASGREEYTFPRPFLADIVSRVMEQQDLVDGLLEELIVNFVDKFDDVKFYTFRAVIDILGKTTANKPGDGADTSSNDSFDNAFQLLSSIENPPASNDSIGNFYIDPPKKKPHAVYSALQHKKAAQEAWLTLLNIGMDREQKKQALAVMSEVIAPWFTQPELLMDFLTDCYDAGGSMSLLALSGVYYLIKERNLDYPAFFAKLYSLLDTDILHSKHRSRFFRLMDQFLSSTHLPAQLVASFIKRLARLSLNAPPSAIVTVVPWIYNLLKSHPLCTFMIHRVPQTEEERELLENEGLTDPFLADEQDPMETRAIDSCLWEIVQLQSHYHPNVATIAKIISEQFTKQMYNLEDFLDHSYQSLFDAEMAKDIKKPPVVEFHIPKRVLLPNDADSGIEDRLLAKLWNFG